jgi:hypothetical protein
MRDFSKGYEMKKDQRRGADSLTAKDTKEHEEETREFPRKQ